MLNNEFGIIINIINKVMVIVLKNGAQKWQGGRWGSNHLGSVNTKEKFQVVTLTWWS